MKNENLKVAPIKIDQLDQVSRVHTDVFGDSFLSQVGPQAVNKYYEWLMTPPNKCHAIGVFEAEQLLGFCYAGVFRNAEVHFIKENISFLFGQIIKKPSLWFSRKLWERLGSSLAAFADHIKPKSKEKLRELDAVRKARFGILSIAVSSTHQGLGIGRMLEQEAEHIARINGYPRMVLSVNPENRNAVSFYKKNGWREIYPNKSQRWEGFMEKKLTLQG